MTDHDRDHAELTHDEIAELAQSSERGSLVRKALGELLRLREKLNQIRTAARGDE